MSEFNSFQFLLKLLPDYPGIPSWVVDHIKTINDENDDRFIERKVVTQSYLDFLEEQIGLESRGPEWSVLLQNRRDAIAPYLGHEIAFLSFQGNGQSRVYLHVDEIGKAIINFELE